ncbi:MAG: carboxypeptidase regulatory-like domain-containing protein, partial [Deltaproteobacteria bacterium]|nr:carboxypeptidase regulatory-like domain-containing protein [Deltaproteobacteria bacterium]
MIKKYFLAFTSLIFLLFAHNVFSDDGMGSIKMIVNDFYTDEPIEGAEILITPCDYTGITDSSGEAIIEEVVPFRNYQIDVQADGYIDGATAFVSVEASNEIVVYVPLKQKSKISGRVTMKLFLGLLRWPLRNAEVKLKKSSDQSFITIGEIQTDLWGRYLFENLDDGSYVVSAEAKQFSKETVELELEGGQEIIQIFSLSWQREESQADQPLAYANSIQ